MSWWLSENAVHSAASTDPKSAVSMGEHLVLWWRWQYQWQHLMEAAKGASQAQNWCEYYKNGEAGFFSVPEARGNVAGINRCSTGSDAICNSFEKGLRFCDSFGGFGFVNPYKGWFVIEIVDPREIYIICYGTEFDTFTPIFA